MSAKCPRCPKCGLQADLCLCKLVQPIHVQTRVVVIAHFKELARTSNTGRLVPICLERGELRKRGLPMQATDVSGLISDRSYWLYPGEEAQTLTPEVTKDGPITLIVPDGNWTQAGKMRHREPELAHLPQLKLPPGPPSRYRLRKSPDIYRVSTLEAIARALGILEGEEVQKAVEAVFDLMVERTLWTRGKLDADEAQIPEDVRHRSGLWDELIAKMQQ